MWSLAQEGGAFAKTKVCVGWCAGTGVFTSTGKGDHQGRPSSGRQKSKLCAARRCQGLAVQRAAISLEKGRPPCAQDRACMSPLGQHVGTDADL